MDNTLRNNSNSRAYVRLLRNIKCRKDTRRARVGLVLASRLGTLIYIRYLGVRIFPCELAALMYPLIYSQPTFYVQTQLKVWANQGFSVELES